jgi:tRNA 2-selenouridine synthase
MTAPIIHIPADRFLTLAKSVVVVDVRAPKEFRQGHIPGAVSMPLFDDDERAVVGTTYSKRGPEEALHAGLDIVGPKMKDFVKQAKKIATNHEILVHCWRGGMRSGAMAWLFSFSGIKTSVLEGGYKAYRHYIRGSLSVGPPLRVLGGMTGSGKTEILHHFAGLGEQVLDLEGLANHKGSAFGSLGQPEQPTNEQFENDLAAKWLSFDTSRHVWVEDESRSIGKITIPGPFAARMAEAQVIFLDIPFEIRVNRLFDEYGSFEPAELITLVQKISKRMGSDIAKAATDDLQSGNIKDAIAKVLKYYDKTYQYSLLKKDQSKIRKIQFAEVDAKLVAEKILWNLEFGIWNFTGKVQL